MDILPKDLIEKVTNELSPIDLITYCKSNIKNTKIKEVCNSNDFWYRRFQRDFPSLLSAEYFDNGKLQKESKRIYLKIFSIISKLTEDSVDKILESLGENFLRFMLVEKYKKELYLKLFNTYFEAFNIYLTGTEAEMSDLIFDQIDTAFFLLFPKLAINLNPEDFDNFLYSIINTVSESLIHLENEIHNFSGF